LRVVLFGDSVAHTLAGGTVYEFPKFDPWDPSLSPYDPQQVALAAVTKPACSFLPGALAIPQPDGSYVSAENLSQFCGDWRGDLARVLAASPTDYLVVALTNDTGDREVEGEIVQFGSARVDGLVRDLFEELHGIAEAGDAELVLLASPPRTGRLAVTWDEGGWREQALAALARRFARTTDRVTVLDLGAEVCPKGDCDAPRAGFDPAWRYDGLHYLPDGAAWVAEWLTAQLDDLHADSDRTP
jgi:hypothetical protein